MVTVLNFGVGLRTDSLAVRYMNLGKLRTSLCLSFLFCKMGIMIHSIKNLEKSLKSQGLVLVKDVKLCFFKSEISLPKASYFRDILGD